MRAFEEDSLGFLHRGNGVEFTFMIRQVGLVITGAVLASAIGFVSPAAAQGATPPAAQPAINSTTGTVVDISGAVIPGAEVVVTSTDGRTTTVHTDADGNFNAGMVAARLRVSLDGFAPTEIVVAGPQPVQVVLRPVNFADSVVVTATRGAERLPSAASSTVLTAAELSNMAAGDRKSVVQGKTGERGRRRAGRE